MMFKFPRKQLSLSSAKSEPALWITRFLLWERLEDSPIRDHKLEKGLNIIYSPDGDARARGLPFTERRIGHGAGKTLFCRLLRYCLGEDGYGAANLEKSVGEKLPDAYVGIELRLKGETWSVLRPLRKVRGSSCWRGVLEDRTTAAVEPMQTLVDALDSAFVDSVRARYQFDIRPDWFQLLAWLARDQECRLDNILHWRSKRAGEQRIFDRRDELQHFVRAMLGLVDVEESKLHLRRTRMVGDAEKARFSRDELRRVAATLRMRVLNVPHLALIRDDALPREEEKVLLVNAARDRRDTADKELDAFNNDAELHNLRMTKVRAEEAIAAREALKDEIAARVMRSGELVAGAEKAARIFSLEVVALRVEGKECPVCMDPLDEVLAEGCRIAEYGRQKSLENLEGNRADAERQLRAAKERRSEDERALENAEKMIAQARAASARANDAEARAIADRTERWPQVRQRLAEAINDASLAEQYDKMLSDANDLEERRDGMSKQAKRLEEEEELQHKAMRGRDGELQEWARDVVRGVIGDEAEAAVKFPDRSVSVDIVYEGERHSTAFDSIDAWAFDVASLLMSIEGHASMPEFWLHDSPREGDLGASIYDRYFHYVLDLENRCTEKFGDIPFQYIITTTSEPPSEVRQKPWLVLTLDGVNANDRLLRRAV